MEENNNQNNQVFGISAQYIKDLSFENIGTLSQLQDAEKQPQIDVKLKVNVEKGTEPNKFTVSLITEIEAKLDSPIFILELTYVGEFVISGFPENMMDLLLYIECPRMIFPFARSIIASTVSEGGFPPLYLAPVNFAELFAQQHAAKNQTIQ